MESAPVIITITDLRRDASRIIGGAVASGSPVFVTQHGHVAAVVLPRARYDSLMHRAALHETAVETGGAPPSSHGAATRPDRAPLAARPDFEGTEFELVETRFGPADPETADFLAAEGFGPGTEQPAGKLSASGGASGGAKAQ